MTVGTCKNLALVASECPELHKHTLKVKIIKVRQMWMKGAMESFRDREISVDRSFFNISNILYFL